MNCTPLLGSALSRDVRFHLKHSHECIFEMEISSITFLPGTSYTERQNKLNGQKLQLQKLTYSVSST